MQKLKRNCIAHAKIKKNLHCPCKKLKKIALPMQKVKRICLAHAKSKKKTFAFLVQEIKKTCIANAEIKNVLHCQSKK